MANRGDRLFGAARWFSLGELGKGGQGTVYTVVPAAEAIKRDDLIKRLGKALGELAAVTAGPDERRRAAQAILESARSWSRDDHLKFAAALKPYDLRPGAEGDQARVRFADEVKALQRLANEPHVLRLIDHDLQEGWIVTQLYEHGSLARQPEMFKGQALAALRALRPVVAAVAAIHTMGMVHRDIKVANIYLNSDNGLVLGDFGIVFFEDETRTRVTETLEKVGTRDWMPPWTHTGGRLESVPPSFDVFALGKVLWSMISGRRLLPYWDKPHNNLAQMFPGRPEMEIINERILGRTLVQEPEDCIGDGQALLAVIDESIEAIEGRAFTCVALPYLNCPKVLE